MGVSSQDWPALQRLAETFPDKVLPCFGIHPWKAHLHSSNICSGTVASAIDVSPVNAPDLPPTADVPLIQVRCLPLPVDAYRMKAWIAVSTAHVTRVTT